MRIRRREAIRSLGVVVSVAVGLVACDSGDPFEPLPVPDRVPAPTTSSVAPPDFSGVALAPVDGSTTTTEVVVGPGRSTLAGRVDGPDGPVEGAVVRLERLVGDTSARLDVVTGPDGLWQAPDILGGRYRFRAWREPDLAMLEPQILFLAAGQTLDSTLVVERFQALALDSAVAPDPPVVGERTNLVVRVSSQVVGEDGVVRATAESGVELTLGTGLGWIAESPIRARTSTAGDVTFTLVCRAPGRQPLTVMLPPRISVPAPVPSPPTAQPPGPPASSTTVPAADPTPETFTLDVPDCVEPPSTITGPPLTTVPLPTTVAPTTTRPS